MECFYYMEDDRKTKRERDNGLLGIVIVVIVVHATLFWKTISSTSG